MNLHRLTVKINGEKEILIVKDIVSFLSAIDAQNGTLANSGMEHLMKNKIEIEEDNGEFWWSPLSPNEVEEIMNNFRKNRI
ncbi:hypothetical protein IJJ97_05335 [bacterium]|nr:hypothetical protein [bacterium]